jgi:hypothetical protein
VKFLLDTNVLSEVRKGSRANAKVRKWFDATPDNDLCVSVLVLGEIRKGLELLRPRDAVQALAIEHWLRKTEFDFGDRVLPVTKSVADQWGRLAAIRPLATTDGLMAATALAHSLIFVTRNGADVQHTGVSILNPF